MYTCLYISEKIINTIEDSQEDESIMPLLGHLEELRKHLLWIIVYSVIGFLCCYSFAEEIFSFAIQPLMKEMPKDGKLIFTSLPEAFFVYIKLSFITGMFIMSPFIFYHIWLFIAPALYASEKIYVLSISILSSLLFISGSAFCYYQIFPFVFKFFLSFSNSSIEAMPSLSLFLSFFLKLLFAFGLITQMPLFAFFLGKLGIISVKKMKAFRKYFIVIAFALGAFLTPPDVFSQIFMAIPIILLYEVSIVIVYCIEYKKRKAE